MKESSVAMHPEQDREFELVLGNKQLFSLLFLIFVLLGVFFAMGYVMGRNSGPSDVARQVSTTRDDDAETASARPATTSSVQESRPPTIPASEAVGSHGSEMPSARRAEASEPVPVRQEPTVAARFMDPKPGQMFLQVSAVARPEAELLVEVLSRKGFRAAMAPGPNDKLIRVLVGPVATEADVAKTRTELESAGFKPMVRRY